MKAVSYTFLFEIQGKVWGEDIYVGVGASLNHKTGCDYLQGKNVQKWTKDETPGKTFSMLPLRESIEGKY